MFGSILSSILTGLHFSTGGLSTLIGVAEKAPQLIESSKKIIGDATTFLPAAKTLYADLSKIVADAKGGKWADEPADIEKLTGDIQASWSKAQLVAEDIAAAVGEVTMPKAA